jgi:hypothetical protein
MQETLLSRCKILLCRRSQVRQSAELIAGLSAFYSNHHAFDSQNFLMFGMMTPTVVRYLF